MGVMTIDSGRLLVPVPGHVWRHGVLVTPWEAIAYDEISRAAQAGEVCPMNLDLEMMFGCNSASVAPSIVKRLERKGLIKVRRYQRFRRVLIVATGQSTARSPSQHVERPHVPRGAAAKPGVGTMSRKALRMRKAAKVT